MEKNFFLNSSKCIFDLQKDIDDFLFISKKIIRVLSSKKKLLIAGNGGSNSDAIHFAAELTNTFINKKRKGLNAIALGQNTSEISSWSNDYSFNTFLKRQVQSYGSTGDVLFLLSTSGGSLRHKKSINLIKAAEEARKKGLFVISLLGKNGGDLKKKIYSNYFYLVKSDNIAIIQQAHINILHYICLIIDSDKNFIK